MVIWEWEWEDNIAHAADADENVTDVSETDKVMHVSETDEVMHVFETGIRDERHQQGEDGDENDSDATNYSKVQLLNALAQHMTFMRRTHYAGSAS